jgi:hypothetical protein
MGELSRRNLIAAAVTATGIAMLPALARAEGVAGGYKLLIEDGVDAISVRTLIAGRLGAPDMIGRIARDVARRPEDLRAIAAEMENGRTIVVACPTVAAALEAMSRRSATRDRRMKTELSRVLPASALEMLVFA